MALKIGLKDRSRNDADHGFSKPPPSATRPQLRVGNPYIYWDRPSNAGAPDRPIRHLKTGATDTKTDTPARSVVLRSSAIVPILLLLGLSFAARAALHDRYWHALPPLDANGTPATEEAP